MKPHIYTITCLTNLHVGSGDTNYNIVDKEVQRDPVTNLPTIHASSLKGALRDHFVTQGDKTYIKTVFGDGDAPGQVKFFSAQLLARPLRVSDGNGLFMRTTSPGIVSQLRNLLLNLGIRANNLPENFPALKNNTVYGTVSGIKLEGMVWESWQQDNKDLKLMIGDEYAVVSDETMRQFDLPVIARNCLENGKSVNLWYEELVPHQSVFYFAALVPEEISLFAEKQVVQIGGNASIGCGFCEIREVKFCE